MNTAIREDRGRSGRIAAKVLFPDRPHGRGCLCLACGTRRHPDECGCFWCRCEVEDDYRRAQERAERAPVSSDAAAAHVARLGWTRRRLAAELGVSVGTAQRVATAGGMIPRRLERRALDLRVR